MIVPFNPIETSDFYEDYYTRQVGDGLAVYSGRSVMDGDGLGSFLGGMMKRVAPALKGLAKSVGKRAIGVARDALDGKDFKSSAIQGLRNVGGDVLDDVFTAVSSPRKRKRYQNKKEKTSFKNKKQRGGNQSILD